jgi:hypothetical protein
VQPGWQVGHWDTGTLGLSQSTYLQWVWQTGLVDLVRLKVMRLQFASRVWAHALGLSRLYDTI